MKQVDNIAWVMVCFSAELKMWLEEANPEALLHTHNHTVRTFSPRKSDEGIDSAAFAFLDGFG